MGRKLFDASSFEGVDAVSSATLTCEALKRTLTASGQAFAAQVLQIETPIISQKAPRQPIESGFWWLCAFLLAAVLLRLRPNPWLRRAFLLASLLALGLWLNLQLSTQQVFAALSFTWPQPGLTAVFVLTVVVPLLTLLVGNVYCGYVCPFGALQELAGEWRPRDARAAPDKAVWRYTRWVKYGLLLLVVVLFALTRDPVVLSADPLVTFFSGARDWTVLGIGLGVIALSALYPRFWCRNLCPAGAFLSLLNRLRLLRKLSPPVFPARCDMGVIHARELDCLRCDRCRHEKN